MILCIERGRKYIKGRKKGKDGRRRRKQRGGKVKREKKWKRKLN